MAVEVYGVSLLQMMENAGRNLADLAQMMLGGRVEGATILVLAGRGHNGGGGLVAARHLANRGARVHVLLSHAPEAYRGVPAHQLHTLQTMDVPVGEASENAPLPEGDLMLDALIGYGLQGPPRGPVAWLIAQANAHPAPILSLDVPSGLEATTGTVYFPCVHAHATLTLALPKTGLLAAPHVVGELFLADIGIPLALYARLHTPLPPIFAPGPLLRLHP